MANKWSIWMDPIDHLFVNLHNLWYNKCNIGLCLLPEEYNLRRHNYKCKEETMFTTYRSEDNPSFPEVSEKIARFMSEKLGVDVDQRLVKWEACTNEASLYSAIIEPEKIEEDVLAIMVKKTGEHLEVIDI